MSKAMAKKSSKKARKRTPAKGVFDMKPKLLDALRKEFKQDTIDISDGYKGNVHIVIVSRKFDGKSDYERQEMLHDIINTAKLTKSQVGKISLLLALSPAEIK